MDHRERVATGLGLMTLLIAQVACHDSSGPGLVPTSIAANSSINQRALAGTDVQEPPSVIVRDQNDAPLSGASVSFTVTAGGGTVTGATVVTNSAGIATVGSWTVGVVEGANTLVATSGTVSVAFTANSANPCVIADTHSVGGSTNGELSLADCDFGDGSLIDFLGTHITTAGTYTFTQSSPSFNSYLWLLDVNANLIGYNDDFGAGSDSKLKAILPPGNFVLGANSYDPSRVGPYTVTSALDATPVTNCEVVFVVRGITTNQNLQPTDCIKTGGFYGDQYFIYAFGGQPITISMSSTAVDSFLTIYDSFGAVFASSDNKDATTRDAQVTFTPAATGFFGIFGSSAAAGVTGPYTIVIQ